jgi:hypothetical protein
MNDSPLNGRRIALKQISMALASIPLVVVSGSVFAEKNASLRTALKYQDTPKDGKDCLACMQFVPGKTPKDKGGCKIMPGDTEIAPSGWCSAFVATPAKK